MNYCAVQEKSARHFGPHILMTPFLGSIIIDVFLQKSRPNLMGHFFTSIPSISATSINFSEKWRSQKRSNLRVGPKIEKIVKVFVMELIKGFKFSLKTIFQFLHKKITSKFAIFAIVGLAKKKCCMTMDIPKWRFQKVSKSVLKAIVCAQNRLFCESEVVLARSRIDAT